MSTHLGKYRLFFDGACSGNPGVGGAGFLIIGPNEFILHKGSVFLGLDYTCNRAEYVALILGLEHLHDLGLSNIECLEVVSDSKLIVEQLRGTYRVHNSKLTPLFDRAKELLSGYGNVSIIFIPRKYNREADGLAKGAIESWRSTHTGTK